MSFLTIHKNKEGKNCSFIAGNSATVTMNKIRPSGKQTIYFQNSASRPRIICGSSVVTSKEANGPLGEYFDIIENDPKMGEKRFEAAEMKILELALEKAVEKSGRPKSDVDLFISGDLLNQITTSSYVARNYNLPYFGLYSACSTMTQALTIGAALVNAGYHSNVLCSAVSHFATAERQYRYPLEYGAQRPPYAQWTCTSAGCSYLSSSGDGAYITSATIGRVVDFGITDLSNMGAAMAPAAMDTLVALFNDTNTNASDYDLILTGDLGKLGSDILRDLMREQGYDLGQNYKDCGAIVYDVSQNCYQGGSGAGCSAAVFNSYILRKINEGVYNKVIFLATGALMSTQSCYQGETMPAISHAIIIQNNK